MQADLSGTGFGPGTFLLCDCRLTPVPSTKCQEESSEGTQKGTHVLSTSLVYFYVLFYTPKEILVN